MTRLLVPLITFGLFCTLASYSFGRYEPGHKQEHHGYTLQERNSMSRLVERSVGKPVKLWRTHAAAAMADVWNIKAEELESPVDIFGEHQRKGRRP